MSADDAKPVREADISPRDLARRVFEAMEANDRVFNGLGMREVEIEPGRAVLEMAVREDMLNGHDICHGGVIFSLADTAVAIAANSYNQSAIAAAADMNFLETAREGEVLRAETEQRSLRKRTALYDVTVTGSDGRSIALFRCRIQRINAKVVRELPGPTDQS